MTSFLCAVLLHHIIAASGKIAAAPSTVCCTDSGISAGHSSEMRMAADLWEKKAVRVTPRCWTQTAENSKIEDAFLKTGRLSSTEMSLRRWKVAFSNSPLTSLVYEKGRRRL